MVEINTVRVAVPTTKNFPRGYVDIPLSFFAIIGKVAEERRFQDVRYGPAGHSLGAWALILEAELNEVKEACIKPREGRDNVINEIIQVLAVGFAALEQHGVDPISGRNV